MHSEPMVPSIKAADGQRLLSLAIGSCNYNETEKPFMSWGSLKQVLPFQMPGSPSDLVELMGFVMPCGTHSSGTHSGGPASLCTFPLMAEHLPFWPVVRAWNFGPVLNWDPTMLGTTQGKT